MANIPTWRGADTDLSGMARLLAAMPNPGQNLAQNLGDMFSDYQTAQQDRAQLAFDEEKLRADILKNEALIGKYGAETDYKRAQTEYMPKEFDLKQDETRSKEMARDAKAGLNIVNTEDKALELNKKRTEQEEEAFTKDYFSQVANLEDPNLRKLYDDEFRERHPDFWKKHTEQGKLQVLREEEAAKAKAKEEAKFSAPIDYLNNRAGNSGNGAAIPNWSGKTYDEKVDALIGTAQTRKGFLGDTMMTKDANGNVIDVPMSMWKDKSGKNEQNALRSVMADPNLSKNLGFSDKTIGSFSSFKPWQWGGQIPSDFDTKVSELDPENQQIVKSSMNLMQFMDPKMVRDLISGRIKEQRKLKKNPKASVDKKELGQYLDDMVQRMNSTSSGYASPKNPFT